MLDAGGVSGRRRRRRSGSAVRRPQPARAAPPQTVLGVEQKAWFLAQLERSTASWKVWGNSVATLDGRTDLQNLPPGSGGWPVAGYGLIGADDWTGYRTERAEIFDFVARVAGFATLAGDRHAFRAGLLSRRCRRAFRAGRRRVRRRLGLGAGLFEAPHEIAMAHPLRALYLHAAAPGAPRAGDQLLVLHGVRASLEFARTHDRAQALEASNPEVAPHLAFLDIGGHGYAVVRAGADASRSSSSASPPARAQRPARRRPAATASPTAPGAGPPASRRGSSAPGPRARCRSPSDGRGRAELRARSLSSTTNPKPAAGACDA